MYIYIYIYSYIHTCIHAYMYMHSGRAHATAIFHTKNCQTKNL